MISRVFTESFYKKIIPGHLYIKIGNEKMKTVYILYKPVKNIPQDALILSFLSPEDEYEFTPGYPNILFARNEMNNIREKACKAYVGLIARIASTPCAGKTLRQVMEKKGKGSLWWYHHTSQKKLEGDNTFNLFLEIFTILFVCEREKIGKIIIYGSFSRVADVLATRYSITRIDCGRIDTKKLIRSLLSRVKYLVKALYAHRVIKNHVRIPDIKPEVIFQGFWDWSVQIDKNGQIQDNYLRLIPEHFKSNGIEYGWFLWLEPSCKFGSEGRRLGEVLKPALRDSRFIFVQRFLRAVDILSAAIDFSYSFKYLKYQRLEEFRTLFREEGCDFWPLLKHELIYYFFDGSIPHYVVMEDAYRRAASFYRPKLAFVFMQFFLLTRAFYRGFRSGSANTIICDMQHGSYAREKTFILLDREREVFGKPDGNKIPVPDYFFTMGELCRDILIENGFAPEKIFITGSARYDYVWAWKREFHRKNSAVALNVLIACSGDTKIDMEMIQAAFFASQKLNLKLYLRSHPFIRVERLSAYKPYSRHIVSTHSSLEEDLRTADLILFNYSTVAEQAFVMGIPLLQWLPCGFNGSVFRDIKIIPPAYSVEGLRRAFEAFIKDPAPFKPSPEHIGLVLDKCFYKMDAQASSRIAQKAIEILKANEN